MQDISYLLYVCSILYFIFGVNIPITLVGQFRYTHRDLRKFRVLGPHPFHILPNFVLYDYITFNNYRFVLRCSEVGFT